MKRNKKIFSIGSLLVSLMIVGGICIIKQPQSDFSESENRILEKKPNFSFTSFLNNEYQDNYEQYHSDQFPNRDLWMKIKTNFELMTGTHKIKDVYISKNDMLMQEFALSNQDSNRLETINAINEFKNKYPKINTSFMLVPNKIALYDNQVDVQPGTPIQKTYYDEVFKNIDPKINSFDLYPLLSEHIEEDIFFKTDHHWTSLGAKYAASVFLEQPLDNYEPYLANTHFYGSLAKKTAIYNISDQLNMYLEKDPIPYVVEYNDTKQTSIYDLSKQFSADPYSIYFGGNYPIVKITSACESEKKLLIFKDSYANAFVPYLIPYYQEIVMVDPRYYYEDINQLIKEEEFTDIMYLFNTNTFFSDDSLAQILK